LFSTKRIQMVFASSVLSQFNEQFKESK